MYRRVAKSKTPMAQRQVPATTGLVYGRVNGGPVPAPTPFRGTVMPTASMGMKMDMNMNVYGQTRPSYGYGDLGLDDYRALHYYGLDGFDNIDF